MIGLVPSATDYSVCFDATNASGSTSTSGYLDQCYNNVAWDGFSDPTGTATVIPVTAGATAAGKNAALASAGAISGKVTAVSGGSGLAGGVIYVYNTTVSATTDATGNYTVKGVPASASGYSVCFDATNATGGTSTTGYLDQCYNNVAWDGISGVPAGTTVVPVSAGATATGKNAALASGGAISGKVTAAAGGGALAGVYGEVFDSSGNFVHYATTDSGGNFIVTGLATSATGYFLCFDASNATGGSSTTGYKDQCYNNVPWDGSSRPTGAATHVPVSAGTTATGKNAALQNG